jgi:hypothetical protein
MAPRSSVALLSSDRLGSSRKRRNAGRIRPRVFLEILIDAPMGDPEVKAETRMALSYRRGGHRIGQAANDALLAKDNHGVEERRRYGLSDDGHARGVDQ